MREAELSSLVVFTVYLQQLSALDVPTLDGGVRPGREENLPIAVRLHGGDGGRVAPELFQAAGRLEAPGPGRHVSAARDEDVPRLDGRALAGVLLPQVV